MSYQAHTVVISVYEFIYGNMPRVNYHLMGEAGCKMSSLVQAWLLALKFILLSADKPKEMSLNGDNWTISDTLGPVKNLQATVPGQIHLDLL